MTRMNYSLKAFLSFPLIFSDSVLSNWMLIQIFWNSNHPRMIRVQLHPNYSNSATQLTTFFLFTVLHFNLKVSKPVNLFHLDRLSFFGEASWFRWTFRGKVFPKNLISLVNKLIARFRLKKFPKKISKTFLALTWTGNMTSSMNRFLLSN